MKQKYHWTIETINTAVSKCNSYKELLKTYPGITHALHRFGLTSIDLYPETIRKPPKYWTIERILKVAKFVNSRNDFYNKYHGAAYAALKLGLLDELFPRVHNLAHFWTEEKVRKYAKECCTRSEFGKKYRTGYEFARKLNILDDLGFETVGNIYKRCIYAIEFEDNHVYIGLTFNLKTRIFAHTTKNHSVSAVYDYIIINPLINYCIKQLTEYISKEDAVLKEAEFLENYKKLNWVILNRHKTGGLGSKCPKITNEEVIETCLKYKTRRELLESVDRKMYALLHNRKLAKYVTFQRSIRKPRPIDYVLWCKQHSGKNNGMWGKKHSEETKKKWSNDRKGEKNWWYGKKHTKETIEKMKQSALKRKR